MSEMRAQLNEIHALIKEGKKAEASALLSPFLARNAEDANVWWLAANAAQTPEEAMTACLRALALAPEHATAKRMLAALTAVQLKKAYDQFHQGNYKATYTLLKPIVTHQPSHLDAWWLAARTAPTPIDAALACQKVLALDADHAGAQQMLVEQREAISAYRLSAAHTTTTEATPASFQVRPWMLFGLIGLVAMLGAGILLAQTITGRRFFTGPPRTTRTELRLGSANAPLLRSGTLAVGDVDEYMVTVRGGALIFAMITFADGDGNPASAVQLLDPNGKNILGSGNNTVVRSGKAVVVQATLAFSSTYTLRLTGTEGVVQGAYVLQIGQLLG